MSQPLWVSDSNSKFAVKQQADWHFLSGADAAVHVRSSMFRCVPSSHFQMSEEIDNAALNVPRAIVTTMILNGATGFAMVLAVLFCLGDIETVLVRSSLWNKDPF